MKLLDRIELNPEVLRGKAVMKGTRLSVQFILGLLAHGADFKEILNEYPTLVKRGYSCLSNVCFKDAG